MTRAPQKPIKASSFDALAAGGLLARAPKTLVAVVVLADLVFTAGLFVSKPGLQGEVRADAQACEHGSCKREAAGAAVGNALRVPTGMPRLLEFTSTHCASCGRMAPLVKRLELKCTAHDGTILPVDVDTDAGDQLATRYGVNELPTFIEVDSDGNEVSRLVGEQPRERLRVALADVNGVMCTEI
jgi:thiol-disulfide isomerase/thioredoxin